MAITFSRGEPVNLIAGLGDELCRLIVTSLVGLGPQLFSGLADEGPVSGRGPMSAPGAQRTVDLAHRPQLCSKRSDVGVKRGQGRALSMLDHCDTISGHIASFRHLPPCHTHRFADLAQSRSVRLSAPYQSARSL